MNKTLFAGIDAGSRAIKIALLDAAEGRIVATGACDQGVEQAARADALLADVLASRGLARDAIASTVATGYGRYAVAGANETVTEITCHATGVHHLHPEAQALVDIGGQDSKFIHLGANGRVTDFSMNDRCAAGTGRFLATALAFTRAEFEAAAHRAARAQKLSSMCSVFAQSEVVSLIARGAAREEMALGVHEAIATRTGALVGGVPVAPPVVFTGGCAQNQCLVRLLAAAVKQPLQVPASPQTTAALGCALQAALAGR